jgi:hypothetical protein
MRTTVDISDDLMSILQKKAQMERKTLKEEVNLILKKGLGLEGKSPPPKMEGFPMGTQIWDYSKAWSLIDELESSAVADKLELKK